MDDSALVSPPALAGPLRLEPFRALQLDPSRVGDPATARLYARPYRGVATRVRSWIDRGDIMQDTTPALYLHEYADGARAIRGVVGALDVSRRATSVRDAAVLPHERIHPSQAAELAQRMQEMKLNPAPILLAQRGPQPARDLLRMVRREVPTRQYLDRAGQSHRIWAIRDPATIGNLERAWDPSRAIIADGHHRYAAYLRNQEAEPGTASDLGLAMIIDHDETPFHLGAIHRVLAGVTLGEAREAAHALGLSATDLDEPAAPDARDRAIAIVGDGRQWTRLALPLADGGSAVSYLHEQLIPAFRRQPRQVYFERTVENAMLRARRGRNLVVLLPELTVGQLWATVAEGGLLPEKATSFQPKPHAGVFIRCLLDAQPAP